MNIVKPSFEILTTIDKDFLYKQIERAARTCYKSEDLITAESAVRMVKSLVACRHLAMLEHASVSVKFICDRGVSHEIVRHRVASYAQESTRYCNYTGEKFDGQISCIDIATGFKYDLHNASDYKKYCIWRKAMVAADMYYQEMIEAGAKPEEARSVLPNSLKTEIIVTMNLREWMHFLDLRAVGVTGAPHPQIKELAVGVLEVFAHAMPEVFGKQYEQVISKED